jgi:hypothetical protein
LVLPAVRHEGFVQNFVIDASYEADFDLAAYAIPPSPSIVAHNVLLTRDNYSYFLIADTGCQKMVAGYSWFNARAEEVLPFNMFSMKERCRFTFGLSEPTYSTCRWFVPAGICGSLGELRVSSVKEDAPGLFSRPGFEELEGAPDIVSGQVHFRALNCSTMLCLTDVGHLAIRIAEWPSG